jgi:hypothetical protein
MTQLDLQFHSFFRRADLQALETKKIVITIESRKGFLVSAYGKG